MPVVQPPRLIHATEVVGIWLLLRAFASGLHGHDRRGGCEQPLGAIATGLTVIVVLVAKFTEGAWLTLLLIPGLMLMMRIVKGHYDQVAEETKSDTPANARDIKPLLVVLPVERWSRVAHKALRFAWTLSTEIKVVHVDCGEDADGFASRWHELVDPAAREAGVPPPELVILRSPFRFVIRSRRVISRVSRKPVVLRSAA